MAYDERAARTFTRAAPGLAVVAALILCIGAGFGLFAAIGTVLTHQPVKRAILFVLVALVMLGAAAIQLALGRRARRLTENWDAQEKPGGNGQ